MSADPAQRYPDVMSLKQALEEFLAGGMSFPTMTVPGGECVVHEGATGDTAYVIQRGWCRVYKHQDGEQVAFADLGPGDVFGEAAVFAESPRTATIQALTEVVVQVVHRDVFEKDLGMASSMGAFVKALARRFVSTDQQLRSTKNELALVKAEAAIRIAEATAAAQGTAENATLIPPSSPGAAMMMPLPPLPGQTQPAQSSTPPSSSSSSSPPPSSPPSSEPPPAAAAPSSPPPVVVPPPVALPPSLVTGSLHNPLALLDAAMKLQTLAKDPGDLGALLLEALSRGAEVLVAERGLKPRADA